MNVARQEHWAVFEEDSLHSEFGPQGDGMHGFGGSCSTGWTGGAGMRKNVGVVEIGIKSGETKKT